MSRRRFLLAAWLLGAWPVPLLCDSYEAPLPAQLATDPDLCAYAPCRDVMPRATSFSLRKGRPSYVEAYGHEDSEGDHGKREKESGGEEEDRRETRREHTKQEDDRHLLGYVFISTDIVDIPAYSGKPLVTLIGMDTKGVITGVRILKHSEPILLLGIPESELTRFIGQYTGKFAGDKVEVGKTGGDRVGVDAISGATVTVIAENQAIMRSAHEIARQVGIVKATPRPQASFTEASAPPNWQALLEEGSIQRLTIEPSAVGMSDTDEPYLDLYFGYLNAPGIGQALLGAQAHRRLMENLAPGEHAIFIVSNGTASFKGSGFVRGGIFDRIRVAQDLDTYTFRDLDYQPLYGLEAAGVPAYRESGIFVIRNPSFSAAYPWSLEFLGNRVDQQTRTKTFVTFEREYWIPGRYLVGGRPAVERPEATWVKVWKSRRFEIVAFVAFLAAVTALYAARDKLVRRTTRKDRRWVEYPKYAVWIASIGLIGLFTLAVPSITQVLTWMHSVVYEWRWELFLSDPLIFIFWWFIIITMFIWGRGLFCGWLCPYGALTELAHKLAGKVGLQRYQFHLPMRWHDRLKWIKYGVFALLVVVSFYSIGTAEKMAEVEPFKSTWLVGGFWTRSWPFVLYWAVLFGLSLFMERPFCKYVCPLGAALAIPTTVRAVPLKRKAECRTCHACQKGCGSLAIDDAGRIDQRECLLCLGCQTLYYDPHTCPPLSQERRRRTRSGLPLTPIGADGYYIPLKEVS